MEKLRVFTSFSGYDSQCLALDMAGIDYELVGWSEIDKYAIQAHNALYPQYADRNYGDITQIDWSKVPDFDFFTYSSPCFVAGTKVRTDKGEINIEDVKVGMRVNTGKGSYPVTKTMCHLHFGNLSHIVSRTTQRDVVCTGNHPFLKSELTNEWCRADCLEKDDWVEGLHERRYKRIQIAVAERIVAFLTPVYNLEVETEHSYIANGFIVHNCQDFSNAGRLAGGTEGTGTRSSLLWHCRKAILAKKPKYLMMENVKNLVSQKFLPTFLKWEEELRSYGYTNFAQVLNAKDYGIPQNRERIFVISILGDADWFAFPKKEGLKLRLKDMLEDKVAEKYYLSDETVQKYVDWSDRQKENGNGFRFEPTNGGGDAKTISTKQDRGWETFIKNE